MLGAIIGDIVGSRFEFDEIPTDNFELFLDKPRCDYTDDSIMTIAVPLSQSQRRIRQYVCRMAEK